MLKSIKLLVVGMILLGGVNPVWAQTQDLGISIEISPENQNFVNGLNGQMIALSGKGNPRLTQNFIKFRDYILSRSSYIKKQSRPQLLQDVVCFVVCRPLESGIKYYIYYFHYKGAFISQAQGWFRANDNLNNIAQNIYRTIQQTYPVKIFPKIHIHNNSYFTTIGGETGISRRDMFYPETFLYGDTKYLELKSLNPIKDFTMLSPSENTKYGQELFSTDTKYENYLTHGEIPDDFKKEFTDKGYDLSGDTKVYPQKTEGLWLIKDTKNENQYLVYTIIKDGNILKVYLSLDSSVPFYRIKEIDKKGFVLVKVVTAPEELPVKDLEVRYYIRGESRTGITDERGICKIHGLWRSQPLAIRIEKEDITVSVPFCYPEDQTPENGYDIIVFLKENLHKISFYSNNIFLQIYVGMNFKSQTPDPSVEFDVPSGRYRIHITCGEVGFLPIRQELDINRDIRIFIGPERNNGYDQCWEFERDILSIIKNKCNDVRTFLEEKKADDLGSYLERLDQENCESESISDEEKDLCNKLEKGIPDIHKALADALTTEQGQEKVHLQRFNAHMLMAECCLRIARNKNDLSPKILWIIKAFSFLYQTFQMSCNDLAAVNEQGIAEKLNELKDIFLDQDRRGTVFETVGATGPQDKIRFCYAMAQVCLELYKLLAEEGYSNLLLESAFNLSSHAQSLQTTNFTNHGWSFLLGLQLEDIASKIISEGRPSLSTVQMSILDNLNLKNLWKELSKENAPTLSTKFKDILSAKVNEAEENLDKAKERRREKQKGDKKGGN